MLNTPVLVYCMLLFPCSLHHRCTMCNVNHCILCTIGVPVKGYVSLFINMCTMCYVSHCILCTIGVPVKGYVSLFTYMHVHTCILYVTASVFFAPQVCHVLCQPLYSLHHRCASKRLCQPIYTHVVYVH